MRVYTVGEKTEDLLFVKERPAVELSLLRPIAMGGITGAFERTFDGFYRYRTQMLNRHARTVLFEKAKREIAVCEREGRTFTPFSLRTEYTETFVSDRILSLSLRKYTFEGGVHGMCVAAGDVWSLSECRRLSLARLTGLSNPEKPIIEEVRRQIREDKTGKFFPDAEKAALNGFSSERFWVEEGQVTVFYPLYSLAPYCAGIPIFQTRIECVI